MQNQKIYFKTSLLLLTALAVPAALSNIHAQVSKGLLNTQQKVEDILLNDKPVFASPPENAATGKYWLFYLQHKGFYYNYAGTIKLTSSCIRICYEDMEDKCEDCSTGQCCITCPSQDEKLQLKEMSSTELQTIKNQKATNTVSTESKTGNTLTGSLDLELKTTAGLPWMNIDVKTLAGIQDTFSKELKTSTSYWLENSTQGSEKKSDGTEYVSQFTIAHHYARPCTRTNIFAGPTYCEIYAMCDIAGDQVIQQENGKWISAGRPKTIFVQNVKVFITVISAGAGILDMNEEYNCKCRNCPHDNKDESPNAAVNNGKIPMPVSKAPVESKEPPKPPESPEPAKPQEEPQVKKEPLPKTKIPPMTSFAQVNVKKGDKVTVSDPYGKGAEITDLETGAIKKIPPNGSINVTDIGKGFLYNSPSMYGPIAVVNQPLESGSGQKPPATIPETSAKTPQADDIPEINNVNVGGTPTGQIPLFGNGSTPPMTVTGNWPEGSDFNMTGKGQNGTPQTYGGNQIVDIQTENGSQGVVKFDDLPSGNPALQTPSISVKTPDGVESPSFPIQILDGKINSKVVPENAAPNSTAELVIEYKTLLPALEQSVVGFSAGDYLFQITYPANITGPATAEINQTGITTASIHIGQMAGTYDIFVTLMPKEMLK